MKCPGCGKEVVIATDLCPWCGYKYNFDGSIEVKDSPGCFDPGEEEPSARRRRGRRAADPMPRSAGCRPECSAAAPRAAARSLAPAPRSAGGAPRSAGGAPRPTE